MPLEAHYESAAKMLQGAQALLIGAGAGMGVDSGLPDFRGNEGFWNAYPPFRERGLSFYDLANPRWFAQDPEQAWGFYGHRHNLYRDTTPHDGFALLRRWGEALPGGYFVFTSNVDGHFQKSGFHDERVFECHGSILHLQCARPCSDDVWPAEGLVVNVDPATFRAVQPLPRCRNCGGMARPNVLMFGDGHWVADRAIAQQRRYQAWLNETPRNAILAIECGAGCAIPTVRHECEASAGRLIRINLRECDVPRGQCGIADRVAATLAAIQRLRDA